MRIGNYESSENSNMGTAITFLLIGLGAGALVGLMFAPKTGKQFRKDLQRGYDDARETLGDWADEAKDRVRDVASRGVDMASDMAGDLRDAARERVEPLRKAINRS
jgi:gas vesicle protein